MAVKKFMTDTMLSNVRSMFPELTKPMSDEELAETYEQFYYSEYAGNNDENFPLWVNDKPLPGATEPAQVAAPPINEVSAADVEDFANACYVEFPGMDRYQELAVRSAIYNGQGTPFGLMYCALGLAEAGEVQNKVKKIFRDDGVFDIDILTRPGDIQTGSEGFAEVRFKEVSEERKAQIVKELGGLLWYVAATCRELGVEMSDVMIANLRELASRSERGTLQGSGDNR